jgi:hypothetical protein
MTIGAHWDGGPDCGPDCHGPHHGDHVAGLVCHGCGGSAYACFQATSGNGCSEPAPRLRIYEGLVLGQPKRYHVGYLSVTD